MSAQTNSFFVVDATLPADSPSYVERRADKELLEGLSRGDLCYVLTSSQMGKSSLMVRTAMRLRARGVNTAVIDLTNIGTNLTADQWYYGLVNTLGRVLGIEDEVDDFWFDQERLGPVQRLVAVLRDLILPELKKRAPFQAATQSGAQPMSEEALTEAASRLVVFVDEINVVRGLPFNPDDFFSAIQHCYHARVENAEFKRIAFCLVGIATPNELIRDNRVTSPFAIGRRIELADFAPENAAALAQGLHSAADSSGRSPAEALAVLDRVLYWTNGHPYLTQRLCRAIAAVPNLRTPEQLDGICEDIFFSSRAREQDPNLGFVRERILRTDARLSDLLKLYLRIWNGEPVRDNEADPLIDCLRLSGVVRIQGGLLVVRNRIYHRVFDGEWVRANLPVERAADPNSIAVLPFKIVGADRSLEYVADGLAEELISALGRLPGLRVASRTSAFQFKERLEDVRKIGAQLAVHHLLEGSVRPVGAEFQVSAQLIQAQNGHSIWSEAYRHSGSNLEEIHGKIVTAVSGKLKSEQSSKARVVTGARSTEATEAYNLYLKGRFYWNRRTESAVRRSLELFQEAVKKDPSCALAYAGLADGFNILATYNYARPTEAYPKAKAAATRALEIDPDLAQAHGALGLTYSVHEWNWEMAENEFGRAIELNPSYGTARHWYAINCLSPLGRHEEALAELRCAQEVDPLSISITASIGLALYLAGRYPQAVEQCQEAVERDPAFWIGQLFLGWTYIQLGRFPEAVDALENSLNSGNKDPVVLAALAHAFAVMGRKEDATGLLAELASLSRTRYVPAMDLVPVHLALGDEAAALTWLDAAFAERSFKLIYLQVDPRLRAIQSHPKCLELKRAIGLPPAA